MPTKKAGYEKKVDIDQLWEAIKSVKIHGNSGLSVARSTGIAESTLRRYINKIEKANVDVSTADGDALKNILNDLSTLGGKPVFTRAEETDLVKCIAKSGEQTYNLSSKEVRTLAYKYAVKNRIHYPDSWGIHQMAGRDWFCGFMERNKNLSLCTPDEIDDKHGTISEMNLDTVLSNDSDKDDVIKNFKKAEGNKSNVKIKNQDVASTSKACMQETDPLDCDNQLLKPLKVQKQSNRSGNNKRKILNSNKAPSTKKAR